MIIINKKRVNNYSYYSCKCPYCGKVIDIRFDHYRIRKRDDCGCLNHYDAINGNHSKLYDIHQAMKQRCLNKNHKYYYRYGGRGIKICEEWLDYKSFKSWALDSGYKEGLDLDRINNDGNYEPNNCRWVSHKINCNNRCNTIFIEYEGKSYTITELANEFELPRSLIEKRYHRGKRGKELVKPKRTKNNYSVK